MNIEGRAVSSPAFYMVDRGLLRCGVRGLLQFLLPVLLALGKPEELGDIVEGVANSKAWSWPGATPFTREPPPARAWMKLMFFFAITPRATRLSQARSMTYWAGSGSVCPRGAKADFPSIKSACSDGIRGALPPDRRLSAAGWSV
jgi:hypothetical protein